MTQKRRAYIRLGRLIGPFALLGLKIYTFITRRPRVRVIVTNDRDEILLVRGVISHLGNWTLPGGGVNRKELLAHAASRELFEETGIKKPTTSFRYMRTVEKHELKLSYTAPLFYIGVKKPELSKTPFNPTEIADIGWFPLENLPEHTESIVRLAVAEYEENGSG